MPYHTETPTKSSPPHPTNPLPVSSPTTISVTPHPLPIPATVPQKVGGTASMAPAAAATARKSAPARPERGLIPPPIPPPTCSSTRSYSQDSYTSSSDSSSEPPEPTTTDPTKPTTINPPAHDHPSDNDSTALSPFTPDPHEFPFLPDHGTPTVVPKGRDPKQGPFLVGLSPGTTPPSAAPPGSPTLGAAPGIKGPRPKRSTDHPKPEEKTPTLGIWHPVAKAAIPYILGPSGTPIGIWSESGPYYFPPEPTKEEKPTTPFAKLRQITMAEPLSPDLQICEMAPSETGGLPKNERPIRRPTPDRAGKSRGGRNDSLRFLPTPTPKHPPTRCFLSSVSPYPAFPAASGAVHLTVTESRRTGTHNATTTLTNP